MGQTMRVRVIQNVTVERHFDVDIPVETEAGEVYNAVGSVPREQWVEVPYVDDDEDRWTVAIHATHPDGSMEEAAIWTDDDDDLAPGPML